MSDNPIHDAERDEWRSAVRQMSEVQRGQACGHTVRVNGVCMDCGHDVRGEL